MRPAKFSSVRSSILQLRTKPPVPLQRDTEHKRDCNWPTKVRNPSSTLYGIMTEEINHSYDGGLYAELVSNRTFQTSRGLSLENWTLIQNGNSQATIEIDKTTGPSAAIPHSAKFVA